MAWEDIEKRRQDRRSKNESEISDDMALSFAKTFSGSHGEKTLEFLRLITKERDTRPDISACALRHLEGQRHLINRIENYIAKGRKLDVRQFRAELGRKHGERSVDCDERPLYARWFAGKFLGR